MKSLELLSINFKIVVIINAMVTMHESKRKQHRLEGKSKANISIQVI